MSYVQTETEKEKFHTIFILFSSSVSSSAGVAFFLDLYNNTVEPLKSRHHRAAKGGLIVEQGCIQRGIRP